MPFRKRSAAVALALVIAGCAPAPVLKPAGTPLDLTPGGAMTAPQSYRGREVVWGGRIVAVRNAGDTSEITVLAFPLDAGQRPLRDETDQGRFVAVTQGYVERYDYTPGRFVSVLGTLAGTRAQPLGGREHLYPLVAVDAIHLWPPGFEKAGPRFHFSLGIRGAIR